MKSDTLQISNDYLFSGFQGPVLDPGQDASDLRHQRAVLRPRLASHLPDQLQPRRPSLRDPGDAQGERGRHLKGDLRHPAQVNFGAAPGFPVWRERLFFGSAETLLILHVFHLD